LGCNCFAFGYGEDGCRQVRAGVQIEGQGERISWLKVAIHRFSQKLADLHVGPAKRLFDTTWKVILKALRSKAFKITHFSVLAQRNGG